MQVDNKFYCNDTIHIDVLQKSNDPYNNTLSCGFLHNQGSARKNINFKYYGGLYVISGTGKYIDGISGKEYSVGPGYVIQRMPDVLHHSTIDHNSNWLEFYFCCGAKVFETLVDYKLVTDEPVFYIGERKEIFDRLLEYHRLFKRSNNQNVPELIIEFQKLLFYINGFLNETQKPDWATLIEQKLQQNCKIGTSLECVINECGIGYEKVRKEFPKYFGCSLEKYRISIRINRAKSMLLSENLSIKEVAYELGYCDVYSFCRQFKQQEGIPPGKFISVWK